MSLLYRSVAPRGEAVVTPESGRAGSLWNVTIKSSQDGDDGDDGAGTELRVDAFPTQQGAATMRNLLGRLNARSPDELQRISRIWQVPLPGADRSRHVGALYRAMTDIRHARAVWDRIDPASREIVRELALGEIGPVTITDLAALTGRSEPETRDAAIRLFQHGMLAREGDKQELPVGATPRLFLPRELGQIFRRVQDEIDAGDMATSSLRVLLEMLDDPEIEEAAEIWGIKVVPGLRRRGDLISQLLKQVANTDRAGRVIEGRGRSARALWDAVREGADGGPLPLTDALAAAGLSVPEFTSPDSIRSGARALGALSELESALLVVHTYRRDGSRWLFVPREILHPGEVAATLPLQPLQPLPEGLVPEPALLFRHALAWDLLTVLREISEHVAPAWTPGEALSRAWQRRVNRRLWHGGEDVPPRGYLAFLLHLALGIGVVAPGEQPATTGADKGAIRPSITAMIREWRRLSFSDQTDRLRTVWLATDGWIEGREREEIDVWGADWRGFRHRLLAALESLAPDEWVMLDDLAARLAEQDPTIIGTTFTAASARSATDRGGREDQRTAAIAQIIAVELETAVAWFGIVELSTVPGRGVAVRVRQGPDEDDRRVPEDPPVLSVHDDGMITLHQPSPLHIWSLSAFADAEGLLPEARFQLRPGAVGRALEAGFDLEQITTYLTRQGNGQLPERVRETLHDWTVGYRRVRMRRAVVLATDSDTARDELRAGLEDAGLDVLAPRDSGHDLVVILPASSEGTENPEDLLLKVLRARGYSGQWDVRPAIP